MRSIWASFCVTQKYMRKFIFIPVVNHIELLEKAIASVPAGIFDEYIIFNNTSSTLTIDTLHFKVMDLDERKTFRDTQNIMRQYALDNNYDYYCFMHNDGEVTDDSTVQRLVKMAEDQTDKWSVIFTNYDVLCAYSTECVKAIGEWGDFKWPREQHNGYYLDNDYYRRMNFEWANEQTLPDSSVLHSEPSNTIKDPDEHIRWRSQIDNVERHYRMKWGGLPGHETCDKSFGDLVL